jgi:hypothetical protein
METIDPARKTSRQLIGSSGDLQSHEFTPC